MKNKRTKSTNLPLVVREGSDEREGKGEGRKERSFWDGIPDSITYMVLRES